MQIQDFESGAQQWEEMVELIRLEHPTWSVGRVNQYAVMQSMLLFGEVYCPVGVMAGSLNR